MERKEYINIDLKSLRKDQEYDTNLSVNQEK